MTNSPLYAELLAKLTSSLSILPDKPEETPTSCLMALWHKAGGVEVSAAAAIHRPLGPLTPECESLVRRLVDERLGGRPLAYLTGRQQFMGLEFISTPQAVIPRKDTEPLVQAAEKCLAERLTVARDQVVIDLFTGSGNVVLSLARRLPGPRYYGSDLSPVAISLAKRNAAHLGLGSACTFVCGDMFAPFDRDQFHGRVDLVSGAPPFISSSKVPKMPQEISQHEPALAFEAGPFGVSLFLRLIADAPAYLKKGGWLFFEVGLGQAAGIRKRLAADPAYCSAQTFCDDRGDIRAVGAQRK
jgi:release factor glutamine methyltransferase